MKILLVGGTPSDHQAMRRAIVASKHELELARDVEACRVFRARETFDAYVIDWTAAGDSAAQLVRDIRDHEQSDYAFVVAILSSATVATVTAAFEAGVDDVSRRPLIAEEVVGRLRTLDRIRRWASQMAPSLLGPSGISRRASVPTLRAWTDADLSIAHDFRDVIGRDVATSTTGGLAADGIGAEVPLTWVTQSTDVCVRVRVARACVEPLGTLVFGSPQGDAAVEDMVRELANTAAGAFKRVAEVEGAVLTMGLPRDVELTASVRSHPSACRAFWIQVAGTPAEIQCELHVRPRERERLNPLHLEEGMVLARDVFSDKGALLLPAGTRLTDATVGKLARLLAPTALVEIARAA